MSPEDHEATRAPEKTEIAVIGAGILGMFNALQMARRGLRVVLLDNVAGQKRSYKVGESLLVFSNAFLRSVGGLDAFIDKSYPKHGVWFTYGMEGKTSFADATEWALETHPPERLRELAPDPKYFRHITLDAQIVRPEAEDAMREALRGFDNVVFLDTVRVKDLTIGRDGAPHRVRWECQRTGRAGEIEAKWLVDCSGRNRLLAKKLGHAVERAEIDDGFQTTAVWGQFGGITDDLFGAAWRHRLADGEEIQRDSNTLHLWGKGYWIWIIRLSNGRISVGVTFDQRLPPAGATPKEQFWDVINRYPLLRRVITERQLLEFRMFRNVQYLTDTFVSRDRYGMAGDSASIIDAYYSQGMSLGFVTSWHIANIAERDLREGRLDVEYIDRVNHATRNDWHIIRNMLREKYTAAIADPRFFLLTHLLDAALVYSILPLRAQLIRWLVDTDGDTQRETPALRAIRAAAERGLFYSQVPPWNRLDPSVLCRVQSHLQAGIGERARWRLEHGVEVAPMRAILRPLAPLPRISRTPRAGAEKPVDLSPENVMSPDEFAGSATPPPSIARRGHMLFLQFFAAYAFDAAETAAYRHLARFGLLRRSARAESPERASPPPQSATAPLAP